MRNPGEKGRERPGMRNPGERECRGTRFLEEWQATADRVSGICGLSSLVLREGVKVGRRQALRRPPSFPLPFQLTVSFSSQSAFTDLVKISPFFVF